MIERNNFDAIENTSNTKYSKLFEKPSYKDIEEFKKVKKEEAKAKVLVKENNNKNVRGFISPLLLGILICLLSIIGMIISYITYLVS